MVSWDLCEACLDEEHSVDHEADVVLGDGGLIWDGDGVLLQRVDIRDPVDLAAKSQLSVRFSVRIAALE